MNPSLFTTRYREKQSWSEDALGYLSGSGSYARQIISLESVCNHSTYSDISPGSLLAETGLIEGPEQDDNKEDTAAERGSPTTSGPRI